MSRLGDICGGDVTTNTKEEGNCATMRSDKAVRARKWHHLIAIRQRETENSPLQGNCYSQDVFPEI